MSSSGMYINIDLMSWDCSKVTIGPSPNNSKLQSAKYGPSVLYEKKVPILRIISDDNKFILKSYNGLRRTMKYDNKLKKYTDIWTGEWDISFILASSLADASVHAKKIIDLYEDIYAKMTKAGLNASNPIKYTKVSSTNEFGVVTEFPDKTKPIYLSGKVRYNAPKDCPKMRNETGADVPALEYRVPKAFFIDVTKARDQQAIDASIADKECAIPMLAAPKFLIGLSKAAEKWFCINNTCDVYYEPWKVSGRGVDLDFADKLRSANSQSSITQEQLVNASKYDSVSNNEPKSKIQTINILEDFTFDT